MKKIVALVLSLVMVLGLATTAFAATTSTGSVATASVTPVKAARYALATATTGYDSMTKLADITTLEKTTVTGKVVADVPYYVPTIWALNGDFFVEVAKASADYALLNNGVYTYLAAATGTTVDAVITEFATPVVLDKLVLPADDEIDCGDAFVYNTTAQKNVVAAYYTSGKSVYYADGTDYAYFNGEFVKYNKASKDAVSFDGHDFDPDTLVVKATDVKGVVVPVSVECEDCEKTFKVVSAITGFDNTWVKGVNYETVDSTVAGWEKMAGYVIVLDGATDANTPAAPEAGDKVESAETFDAGIAMYVGMSVMAAAGSAVVLKKKD